MANDYALRCQDEPVLLARFRDEADAGGPVEVLTRSWNFEGEVAAVASLPPVYADLLAIGDARCLETANLLHERIVDRFNRQDESGLACDSRPRPAGGGKRANCAVIVAGLILSFPSSFHDEGG